jgi:hypothetical protein
MILQNKSALAKVMHDIYHFYHAVFFENTASRGFIQAK